jgi:RNA polymerase sigma-70 factor (ECF subfamily)
VESDGVRVRAVIAGSSGAYAALYDRYARLIRAVCHDTTGNVADAQDLCQEVFLRAYRNLGCLRDQERFAGWLLGIARTTCREWRRKVSRERRRRQPLELDPAAPEEQRGAEPLTDRLLATIARLPERERLAMHLFYLQEQPAEVAREVMRLSRSGFYRVLDRARRRLRRMIGAKGEPNQ